MEAQQMLRAVIENGLTHLCSAQVTWFHSKRLCSAADDEHPGTLLLFDPESTIEVDFDKAIQLNVKGP